jgi:hypothetical protein
MEPTLIHLDAEQIRVLAHPLRSAAELDAVVERYRTRGATDPEPDARQVLLQLYALPRLGDAQ